MRRIIAAALTLFALVEAAANAQAPENAPEKGSEEGAEAVPQSRPLVPPPPKLFGPEFMRMRGITAPPPSATDQQKITNYFYHIKKLIEQAEAKPLPEPKKPDESAKSPQSYGFEDVEGLTSRDMMRALREAAEDARINNMVKSEEYIDRQIAANARIVLEYYPLAAVDPDARNNLLYAMEDPKTERAIRRMLYTLAIPGRGHDSLFARYLQDAVRDESERVTKMYGVVLTTPGDDPVIRQLAAENLYAMRLADLKDFLAGDPNAKAFQETHGHAPEPTDLRDPSVFSVSSGNRVRLKKELAGFEDLAKLLGKTLEPSSDAPQPLRDGVAAVLTKMQAEIPFEDPEFIAGLLKQAGPAKAATAPEADTDALAF